MVVLSARFDSAGEIFVTFDWVGEVFVTFHWVGGGQWRNCLELLMKNLCVDGSVL